jgi:hypothetical protein
LRKKIFPAAVAAKVVCAAAQRRLALRARATRTIIEARICACKKLLCNRRFRDSSREHSRQRDGGDATRAPTSSADRDAR